MTKKEYKEKYDKLIEMLEDLNEVDSNIYDSYSYRDFLKEKIVVAKEELEIE